MKWNGDYSLSLGNIDIKYRSNIYLYMYLDDWIYITGLPGTQKSLINTQPLIYLLLWNTVFLSNSASTHLLHLCTLRICYSWALANQILLCRPFFLSIEMKNECQRSHSYKSHQLKIIKEFIYLIYMNLIILVVGYWSTKPK